MQLAKCIFESAFQISMVSTLSKRYFEKLSCRASSGRSEMIDGSKSKFISMLLVVIPSYSVSRALYGLAYFGSVFEAS